MSRKIGFVLSGLLLVVVFILPPLVEWISARTDLDLSFILSQRRNLAIVAIT